MSSPYDYTNQNNGAYRYTGSQLYEQNSVSRDAPYGVSWGPDMPNEMNQYAFRGTYQEYFIEVYRQAFPQYQLMIRQKPRNRGADLAFVRDGRQALIVELVSEVDYNYKLECSCNLAGVPFLRFFYDHYGWWNTRNYVVRRTRAALGL